MLHGIVVAASPNIRRAGAHRRESKILPDNLPAILLGLFSLHLVVFLVIWVRTRQFKYLLIATTFVFLVASYAFRVFVPEAAIGGTSVFQIFRVMAWVMVAVSLFYTQVILRRRRRV